MKTLLFNKSSFFVSIDYSTLYIYMHIYLGLLKSFVKRMIKVHVYIWCPFPLYYSITFAFCDEFASKGATWCTYF